MIRLIAIAILLSVGCRWIFGKWPWEYLQATDTSRQAISKAREILGVREGADAREIRDAHRRIVARTHPDRGGNSRALQEANAARDLLLKDLSNRGPEEPE